MPDLKMPRDALLQRLDGRVELARLAVADGGLGGKVDLAEKVGGTLFQPGDGPTPWRGVPDDVGGTARGCARNFEQKGVDRGDPLIGQS